MTEVKEVAIPARVQSTDPAHKGGQSSDEEFVALPHLALNFIHSQLSGLSLGVYYDIFISILFLAKSKKWFGLYIICLMYNYITGKRANRARRLYLVFVAYNFVKGKVSTRRATNWVASFLNMHYFGGGGNYLVGVELNPGPPKKADPHGKDKAPRKTRNKQNNESQLVDQIAKLVAGVPPAKEPQAKVQAECRLFRDTGECKWGDKCKFVHTITTTTAPSAGSDPESESLVCLTAKDELKQLNEQDELDSYHRMCAKIKDYFPNFDCVKVVDSKQQITDERNNFGRCHSEKLPDSVIPPGDTWHTNGLFTFSQSWMSGGTGLGGGGGGDGPTGPAFHSYRRPNNYIGGYFVVADLPKEKWIEYFPNLVAIRPLRAPASMTAQSFKLSAQSVVSYVMDAFDMWDQHEWVSKIELVVSPFAVIKSGDERPIVDRLEKERDDWLIVMQPMIRVTLHNGVSLFTMRDAVFKDLTSKWFTPRLPLEEINRKMYFSRLRMEDHPRWGYVFSEIYISCYMLMELMSRKINLPPGLLNATSVERAIRIYSEKSDSNSFVGHLLTISNVQRDTISLVTGFITRDMSTPLQGF